ncbi:tumor protein D52 isoform X2 [Sphaeramia orbicularis]|uniref:tumor protein D52 isoform X2 n=1 Tax=Sphaeramia orbicularis TaxID=375764 RepID=UPI00117C2327|nr:tumor protein D52 isoform X2 [Sphaeramia orbicularis]
MRRDQEERLQPSVEPAVCEHQTAAKTTSSRTMDDAQKGSQLLSDSVPEVGEDAVTSVAPSSPSPPAMTEEERLELQQELAKVEDEIQTLTQVLSAKEKQVADIKRKLGITPLNELKQNISKTWQGVTTSNAYRRTSETISQASLKATAALSTVGSAIGRKLEDVSMCSLQHSTSMPVIRNAPTFKSFEEKVETLKTKMTPSTSTGTLGAQDASGSSGGAPADESTPNQQEDSTTDETPMQ